MAATPKPLRSGELARLANVSADTLRHYEKLGILPCPPRTESGYRMYAAGAVDRVQLVHHAQQLGFSLAELSEIFQTRDSGGAPCRHVLRLAEQKLLALKAQITQLGRTERYLRRLIRDWRSRLSRTSRGKKALLLQTLAGKPALRARTLGNLKRRHST
jgi:DNA-binding transcriptional MerR regulator